MQNEQIFDLCRDGEQIIKTYECTSIKKLFFGASKGRLTLTNKRVLYHATGKSLKGKSLVLNEMPVEDVSGVSTYLGTSINWMRIALFVLIMQFLVTPLIFSILPRFATGRVFGIIMMLPFVVRWIWKKDILSQKVKTGILDNLKGILENEYVKKISPALARKISRYAFYYGILVLGLRLSYGGVYFLRFAIYIGLYFLIYGASRVFSLMIYSKSTKGTGIHLPGVQQFGFHSHETTAADTMSGSPAIDSETVIHEIGAIITDLKQMGDLAVDKWSGTV